MLEKTVFFKVIKSILQNDCANSNLSNQCAPKQGWINQRLKRRWMKLIKEETDRTTFAASKMFVDCIMPNM